MERITVRDADDEALRLCPDDRMAFDLTGQDLFSRRIRRATELLSKRGAKSPYDAVIVDETQDLDARRLALIRLLAGRGRDAAKGYVAPDGSDATGSRDYCGLSRRFAASSVRPRRSSGVCPAAWSLSLIHISEPTRPY